MTQPTSRKRCPRLLTAAWYSKNMIRFTASPVTIDAADGEGRREIMGLAAPYNVEATVADGTTVKFLPGSLPV